MKAIVNAIFLLSIVSCSLAQNGTVTFKHITTNEGLSQSTVTSILQDDDGFIWFGTQDGLNRYDGKSIKVYKNDPLNAQSLGTNFIHTLFKDRDGNIWIGSDGGGLILFDKEHEVFSSYKYTSAYNATYNNRINSIAQDRDGNLWVGTFGDGLAYFDIKTKAFTSYVYDPNNPHTISNNYISDILIDRNNDIWVATFYGGLNKWVKSSKTFIRFKHDPTNKQSLSRNDISSLLEDSKGNLWIGTDGGGLNLFDVIKNSWIRLQHDDKNLQSLSHNDVLSLEEDAKGNIWVGTRNGGVSILQAGTRNFINLKLDEYNEQSLTNNSVYSLYKDKHGNMWVGTYSGGVNFMSGLAPKFYYYKNDKNNNNSLSNNNVLSIIEDHEGKVWIGTDGGGVNILNRETDEFKVIKQSSGGINSDYVLAILEDRDRNLWFGNFKGGLDFYNRTENKFINLRLDKDGKGPNVETIGQLVEDNNGDIWIGTYGTGLSRYHKETKTFDHFTPDPAAKGSFSYPVVFSLYNDSKGNIWAGTAGGGLNLFDEKTKSFICFKNDSNNPESISSSLIYAIFEDSKGNLWIGTSRGLNLFHWDTKTFTHFHEADGLPNEVIYGISEDGKGNLWLSTNKGLSKFDVERKIFRNYDTSDGLQGNSFNRMSCFKNKKGEIYFGGVNGFNVFHPDSIVDNAIVPDVYITNFEIFNKPVSVHQENSPLQKVINDTDEIKISYKESVFAFDFAALNYISSEKNQYAYKMEGFDKDWIYSNTNKAIYTNLNPGEYIFKVKASNNDGVWNTEGAAIILRITPPFWQTWIFRIIVALCIAAAGVSLHQIRLRIINKQKIALEKEVKIQTAEIMRQNEALAIEREEAEKARQEAEQANQAKSIFLATMSHEIRTPMNGVLGMTYLLSETNQTKEQQEYTETIRNSGQALLAIINDILDFSKIDSGNLELEHQPFDLRQCVEEVMDVFSAKAAENGIDLLYQIDHDLPTHIVGDKYRLRQILINLINNAVKFTIKGEIFVGIDLVSLVKDNLKVGFHVRDTGIGIPPDKLSRLFKAFSQVDSATNRKYGGTGLGLVISQRLVELMNGRISVESQPDVGTTFRFTIECQVSDEGKNSQVVSIGNDGKRVLLVDENMTNLNVLKEQLEQWKLSTTMALSGEQALNILDEPGFFDLALVDMQMPNMDGLELSKRIKTKLPHLPIILISPLGDESKKKYPELFSAVLSKPVKQMQLAQDIEAALKTERRQVRNDDKPKYVLSVDFAEKFPLRILLAEDNLVNQKLAIRILNKLGYQHIEVAQNGLEAVEKLKAQFYEVILMDMQMPEMDGLEATRTIRKQASKQPVIIAMTANAMQGDRDLCLQVGMNEYLTKPIKLEALMTALEEASESFKLAPKLIPK